MTFLEAAFPFRDVSRLVAADRRSPDPAYQAHRWWARRPPALVRAALLAAALPAETEARDFWRAYASPDAHLDGMRVTDPFLGGGTTLVEAARLGAQVTGTDVDPLAVLLSAHQLEPPAAQEVLDAGARLTEHLRSEIGALWPEVTDEDGSPWQPLHYFSIARVTCPDCDHAGPLYRSLVLARSIGRAGGVRRQVPVTAFCPDCFAVHALTGQDSTVSCCGREHPLASGTYRATRYTCPACGAKSSHERLQTGAAPRVLVAVEDTPAGRVRGGAETYRRIRAPRPDDEAGRAVVHTKVAAASGLPTEVPLTASAGDNRPLSFGITTVGALHTARQVGYLAAARQWIDDSDLAEPVARALRLAVSTTITSNNRLCGYATDYGRLAPLFSVRAFSLPWLTAELNPLNPVGGRGTLTAALSRVARSCGDEVRRHVVQGRGRISPLTLTLPRRGDGHTVACADATTPPTDPMEAAEPLADLCFTDPPYFDFIPYDTLSQVFRAWQPTSALSGAPLLPTGAEPVTAFGTRLGAALAGAVARCKPNGLIAFTYKGNDDAWDAVGLALDEAKLRVTALWPVLADPHMGHHSHEGNCEYDLLVVARPVAATLPRPQQAPDVAALLRQLGRPLTVSAADEANIRSAARIATARWGQASI